ncbi:MAG: DUF1657 domain-containing protein [Epulopiscium sp.]|nr:DUF1657 domain-containing protein [Candidatus Epulonipiscium sp.]
MPVDKKLRATLATLEGIAADFTVSYLETSDAQTKQMFEQLSTQTNSVIRKLKGRIEDIEEEEPQYREGNK